MDPWLSISLGMVGGLVAGVLIAGIRTAGRIQRAEAESAALRKQLVDDREELTRVRAALAEAQYGQAVAETRCEEMFKNLQEQKTLLAQARQELVEAFRALSGEALKQNNQAFLDLAKSSFQTLQAEAKGELLQRQQAIEEIVRPLCESLGRYEEQVRELERARLSAYTGLDQHLRLLGESQRRLQQETANLVSALRAPGVRGRWGELTLRRIVELAGMVRYCDFVEQEIVQGEEGRFRPDLIVQLPNGRQIVVDAKAVLSAYLDAHEAPDERQRCEHLRRHAAQVRARMDELRLKAYWTQLGQTPEFVVLFLPGEQFLGAALEQDPALVEDGFSGKVVIATPTTLFALLRAVAYGWQQAQVSENAQQVAKLGKELYERMAMLADHLGQIGQSLNKSVQSYNRAIGSLSERVLPAARRFKDLGVASDKEVPLLEPIDTGPGPMPSIVDCRRGEEI